MNKKQLNKKLIEDNIPLNAFCLEGGLPSEVYCLNENGNTWEVYYSERGIKSGLRKFSSEQEACDYFYAFIRTDGILYPKT